MKKHELKLNDLNSNSEHALNETDVEGITAAGVVHINCARWHEQRPPLFGKAQGGMAGLFPAEIGLGFHNCCRQPHAIEEMAEHLAQQFLCYAAGIDVEKGGWQLMALDVHRPWSRYGGSSRPELCLNLCERHGAGRFCFGSVFNIRSGSPRHAAGASAHSRGYAEPWQYPDLQGEVKDQHAHADNCIPHIVIPQQVLSLPL